VLLKIVAGLVMLSVLVIIHEAGHFVLAKLFKVGVPVFSIGMGPRVTGFQVGDTDFRIAAFPVGGYVQMAGADPFGEEDPDAWLDPEDDFMQKPVWQRLLIMLAGPAANLLLPLVVLTAVLVVGENRADSVVGLVLPDTPAAQVGLQASDEITSVNDQPVDFWGDLAEDLEGEVGKAVVLGVKRDGQQKHFTLPVGAVKLTPDVLADMRALGLSWMKVSSQVGVDDPTSPAARAGLATGDAIVAVDGDEVRTWQEMMNALSQDALHQVTYRHPLNPKERTDDASAYETRSTALRAIPDWSPRSGDPLGNVWGLVPVQVFVGAYAKDSAASAAGVELNDRIYAIDGKPVRDWNDLLRMVQATAPPDEQVTSGGCLGGHVDLPQPRELKLTVIRDGKVLDLAFRPRMTRELVRAMVRYRPLIGIKQYPDAFVDGHEQIKRYGLFEAMPEAARETTGVIGTTFGVLAQFVTRERKASETIGGPIAIFDMAGKSAASGLTSFGRMMAAISVGLAIINLLPVPVLDGGQILFFAIEGLRGRPLSLALRERIQMIGVLLLVVVFLYVSVSDISRVISGG